MVDKVDARTRFSDFINLLRNLCEVNISEDGAEQLYHLMLTREFTPNCLSGWDMFPKFLRSIEFYSRVSSTHSPRNKLWLSGFDSHPPEIKVIIEKLFDDLLKESHEVIVGMECSHRYGKKSMLKLYEKCFENGLYNEMFHLHSQSHEQFLMTCMIGCLMIYVSIQMVCDPSFKTYIESFPQVMPSVTPPPPSLNDIACMMVLGKEIIPPPLQPFDERIVELYRKWVCSGDVCERYLLTPSQEKELFGKIYKIFPIVEKALKDGPNKIDLADVCKNFGIPDDIYLKFEVIFNKIFSKFHCLMGDEDMKVFIVSDYSTLDYIIFYIYKTRIYNEEFLTPKIHRYLETVLKDLIITISVYMYNFSTSTRRDFTAFISGKKPTLPEITFGRTVSNKLARVLSEQQKKLTNH
jgi:hypothetical protein